jgi:hypothetical protein
VNNGAHSTVNECFVLVHPSAKTTISENALYFGDFSRKPICKVFHLTPICALAENPDGFRI